MASLAEIRARLAAAENKNSGNSNSNGGSRIVYPHWNILEGQTATLRFLPDGNPSNTFFWIEQQSIRLEFPGIKGETTKPVIVNVPCVEMWNETCPVLTEVRTWFKDKSLEEQGRKYWKKRQYHFQGFVRENPLADDQPPENPIRRFSMTAQLYNVIKGALMDPELEELPTDYERGLDFRVVKTSKGGFANYDTSSWARRESALTDFERTAIEQYGLFDLATFLPKKPSAEELKVIYAMFEASVDGQIYDPDKWSAYYKPYGFNSGSDSKTESAPAAAPTRTAAPVDTGDSPLEEKTTAPAASAPNATAKAGSNADDILAMIRSRQKKADADADFEQDIPH